MSSRMQFTQIHQPEIDPGAPLIYLWEITNESGAVVGRYVGKAEGGAKRPTEDYVYNVNRLLAGKPYRTRGGDYRRVHRALADATRAGNLITLSFLSNVSPEQDIYAVERHFIHEYGCLNDDNGLNAKPQNYNRRKDKRVRGTAREGDGGVAVAAGTSGTERPELEAFRSIIAAHFPELRAISRKCRYSFQVADKTRILRALQETPGGRVNVKLALTSRREKGDRSFNWGGTVEEALVAAREELAVYEKHFKKD